MTALSIIQDAVLHQRNLFIAALIAPVTVLVVYLLRNELIRYQSRIKHLPGPTGWPIVGNLFQVRSFGQYSELSIAKRW
jgi:3-hydroxyphenylacetate 6-hydroxylase